MSAIQQLLMSSSGGGAPGITFTDTFNRANSGTLGVASGGFTWINLTAGIGIVSNKANGVGVSNVNTGFTGVLTASAAITSDLSGFSLVTVWGDGTANNYMGFGVTPTTGTVQVFTITGGSYALVLISASPAVVAGVEAVLQLVVTGTPGSWNLVLNVNGTSPPGGGISGWAGPAFTHGGFAGITTGSAADTFDNFSVVSP